MDKTLIEEAASEARSAMDSTDPMGVLIKNGLSRCHNDAIEAAASMVRICGLGACADKELIDILVAGIISLRTDIAKKS